MRLTWHTALFQSLWKQKCIFIPSGTKEAKEEEKHLSDIIIRRGIRCRLRFLSLSLSHSLSLSLPLSLSLVPFSLLWSPFVSAGDSQQRYLHFLYAREYHSEEKSMRSQRNSTILLPFFPAFLYFYSRKKRLPRCESNREGKMEFRLWFCRLF